MTNWVYTKNQLPPLNMSLLCLIRSEKGDDHSYSVCSMDESGDWEYDRVDDGVMTNEEWDIYKKVRGTVVFWSIFGEADEEAP